MNKSLLVKKLASFFHSRGQVSFKESKGYGFVMCSLTFRSEEQMFVAHGQGKSKDEAAFKCLMEAIERFVVNESRVDSYSQYGSLIKWSLDSKELEVRFSNAKNWIGTSTNGVAVHTSKSKAKESAINELIERHTVLKALSQKISPLELGAGDELLKFYAWGGLLDRFIVMAKGSLNGHKVYGFGCNTSLGTAKEKAHSEISPRLSILQRSSSADLKVMSTNRNFLFHWYENSSEADSLIENAQQNMPEIDIEIRKNDIWIGSYTLSQELSELGIHVIKAVSPKMQNLFAGEWSVDKLNPMAISLDTELPDELHMIG